MTPVAMDAWSRSVVSALACGMVLGLVGCGTSASTTPVEGPAVERAGSRVEEVSEVASPRARAEAAGWTPPPAPPPYYCNDEGGTEWCDGANDDDCDGEVDEGCADCVRETCVRYEISAEEVRRGAGREGRATCIGPVYCGRIDGHATTTPPGGCGHHHCGTVMWNDGTAQPNHCTIYGRCGGGEFTAKGFSW